MVADQSKANNGRFEIMDKVRGAVDGVQDPVGPGKIQVGIILLLAHELDVGPVLCQPVDRDQDSIPFNWELDEQYALIHSLQPACLIGNNHHETPFPGEDIQIFERDLPGENKAGLSGQDISRLPLETCQTMNGMWGYKLVDQNYKSTETLLRLLVSTSGKGANLLLNVGPQPNGEIPATALARMKEMGEWLRANGETVYGTTAGDIQAQEWGVTTRKGDRLFVHIFDCKEKELLLPLDCKVKKAFKYSDKKPVKFQKNKEGVKLMFNEVPTGIDYIVELITK